MSEAEIAAVVVGLTEVIKNWGLPSKACPTFAIVAGAAISGLDAFQKGGDQLALYQGIMKGVVIGTTSTGIYSVTDKMITKTSKPQNNGYFSEETY